jgi:thiopeptide-type bacteriocin biosynthesis protein
VPTDELCLYTLMHAPSESHDALLRDFVRPVVTEIAGAPEMDCIFFARYSEPDYQLRFRVLGRPAWIDGPVRRRIEQGLVPMREAGLVKDVEFASYQREGDRYGGEVGMPLAEAIFLHDTLACLDLLDAEARGTFRRTRREWSLLFTERFLDLFGLDRDTRTEFYRFSHSWAIKDGDWNADDLKALDAKFEALKPGLVELLSGETSRDPAAQWGGDEPAAIAARALDASRPVAQRILEGHRSGAIPQDLLYLVWSYTHMHANRLGIWATSEAIVRYFMWRLYTDTEVGVP